MERRFSAAVALSVLALGAPLAGAAATAAAGTGAQNATPAPADRLLAALPPPLAGLAAEVLERNPDLARLRSTAAAAAARAPQMRSLPDPMASLTAFLLTPETRVGPQQAAATISQRFPWFGKLELRERQALFAAAAADGGRRGEAARAGHGDAAALLRAGLSRRPGTGAARRPGDPGPLRGAVSGALRVGRGARAGGDQAPGGDHPRRQPAARAGQPARRPGRRARRPARPRRRGTAAGARAAFGAVAVDRARRRRSAGTGARRIGPRSRARGR